MSKEVSSKFLLSKSKFNSDINWLASILDFLKFNLFWSSFIKSGSVDNSSIASTANPSPIILNKDCDLFSPLAASKK